MVDEIIPHIKNASIINRVVESAEMSDRGIMLEQQRRGKCGFILDARGNVVAMNGYGEELAQSAVGVTLDNGKLQFSDPEAQQSLDQFLSQRFNLSKLIELPRLAEFPLKLDRFPVRLNCRTVKKTLDFSAHDLNRKFAVLEISSPWEQGWPPIRDIVANQLLTYREKQVLFSLMNHLNEGEAAEALNISLNTLRTHRKHVYDKMLIENRKMLVSRF